MLLTLKFVSKASDKSSETARKFHVACAASPKAYVNTGGGKPGDAKPFQVDLGR